MSQSRYDEHLAAYIHELPTAAKNILLRRVALSIFEPAKTPELKLSDLAEILSSLRPELHAGYDREALTKALGEYLTEWWGELLERPLTGRDMEELLDHLPEYGIREALKDAAEQFGVEVRA